MNILVTGGAGYIGSHTCKRLAEYGYTPVTFDNLSSGHAGAVRWGPLIVGDIRDTVTLEKALKDHSVQAVVHFAAHAYVGESVQNPLKYYENNTIGSISLLRAMRNTLVEKLVFSSTCAVYGNPTQAALTEDHPANPINPYGRSKRFVEQIFLDESRSGQLRFVSLRYFNAAGASTDGDIGERHNPETHLIPLAIQSHITTDSLRVFGNDYDTPDGTAIRDYVHVDDLAAAHVLSLKYLDADGPSDFFNLGTGTGYSVMEIISALERLGARPKYEITGRREGDPARLVADARKAESALGWSSKNSSLDHILKTALQWHFQQR
jgi:UDP-arabinose 4-epimerase